MNLDELRSQLLAQPERSVYSTREAAALLGYTSDATIRQMILRGSLKAEKIGERWLVPKAEIIRLKAQR